MKLHRLVLTNFRGVDHREIAFPDSGVIVLEGPNEVGKTSMIEALDLLLEEKDSSKKRQVEAVRPVGKDVATEIEAEISSGEFRFTYRKQWFRKPATELTITAPRLEHHVGLRAHDRVGQILAETTDTELWKALRLMQATPLTQGDLSGSAALGEALDRAAGQALAVGAEGESVIQSAEAEYVKYFTARAGSPTGEYRDLQKELAELRAAAADAQRALDEVEQDAEEYASAEGELARCDEELGMARAERAELEEQWTRVSELRKQAEDSSTRTRLAESEHAHAVRRRDERGDRVRELVELEVAFAALRGEAGRLRDELAPREGRLAELREVQANASAVEQGARSTAEIAERDRDHLRAMESLRDVLTRVRQVEEADERRAVANSSLTRLTVDTALRDRIDRAERELDTARAEQRVAGARLTVTALADGRLDVDGEPRELHVGEVVEPPLGEALDLEVPGSFRFSFQPEAGAGQRAEKVARAEAALVELLRVAGARSAEHARDLHARRLEAETDRRAAADAYQLLLAGETIEGLGDRRRALQDSTAAYDGQRPDGPPLPADLPGAEAAAAQARAAHGRAREAAEEARSARDAAQGEIEELRLRLRGAEVERDAKERTLEAARESLARQRAEMPDESLATEAAAKEAVLVRARAEESELRDRLAREDPDAVDARLKSAKGAAQQWEERRERQVERRAGIGGRLEKAGSQGLQERSDSAMTHLEHAQRSFASIERRARAARLLQATLQRHRAEAQRAYVAPFANEMNRLGRVVHDTSFEVEVDDQLRVVARVLGGQRIEFDALSTGAKEQLAVLTRLACAALVDGDQGVPVVIDDALGYSDPDRLRRICAAFGLVETGSQVILLTCTPGRYTGIGAAEFRTLS